MKSPRASASVITEQYLDEFASSNMIEFGAYTIEDRALPDYRDGFKPVQRRILWAMHKMHLLHNGATKKVARVTGECIGKYHPHGLSSVYGALVGMSGNNNNDPTDNNTPWPLIQGQGNFGPLNTKSAADRYIECKLHKNATWLLNTEYLHESVTKFVPNYDGEEEEPLILPALVPNLLLNGCTGIAVGVITGIPPYKPPGIINLLKIYLAEGKVTSKQCLKYLKVNYVFGGVVDTSDTDMLKFYNTGEGRIVILPKYEISGNKMIITEVPPYFSMADAIEKLMNIDDVFSAQDHSDKKEPIKLVVTLRSNVGLGSANIFREIADKLKSGINLRLNMTKRRANSDTPTFVKFNSMPEYIAAWVDWRVQIEKKVQQRIYDRIQEEISHLKLLELACLNLDAIVKIIKDKVNTDYEARLVAKLKITTEQAKIILATTVRRLSALSQTEIQNTIKEKKKQADEAMEWVKNPDSKVMNDLDKIKT